jgi:hypothetical protein
VKPIEPRIKGERLTKIVLAETDSSDYYPSNNPQGAFYKLAPE